MRSWCALLVLVGLLVGAAPAAAQAPPPTAVISPDGKRAAWPGEDARQLWSATRASAAEEWRAPLRLLTIRGTVAKIAFSPDSKQIAFENRRASTHGFIAVFDLPSNKILYVDPVFATDTDPAWTADGQIRYVRRIPGVADQMLTKPAPQPDSWRMPLPRPGDAYPIASALQAPIAYAPEPAADGRSVAYITWESTTRAINFMRLGESARRVVEYTADDGIELSQLAITSKGDAVAFVRGGAPNSQGDSPNPRSLPDPAAARDLGRGHAGRLAAQPRARHRAGVLARGRAARVAERVDDHGRDADLGRRRAARRRQHARAAGDVRERPVEPALLARQRQDRVPARLGGRGLRHRGGDDLGRAAAERLRRRAGLVARRRAPGVPPHGLGPAVGDLGRRARHAGHAAGVAGRDGRRLRLLPARPEPDLPGPAGRPAAVVRRRPAGLRVGGRRLPAPVLGPARGRHGDAADARRGRGRVGRADARPQADRLHDQHRRQRSPAPVTRCRSTAARRWR